MKMWSAIYPGDFFNDREDIDGVEQTGDTQFLLESGVASQVVLHVGSEGRWNVFFRWVVKLDTRVIQRRRELQLLQQPENGREFAP